jgi:hypothetical protein
MLSSANSPSWLNFKYSGKSFIYAQFGTLTLQTIAIKLRWSNDGQLGMPETDTIILATSQICYKLSPGLHYNVDSKQKLLCFIRLIVHHIVAVSTTILIPTDPRIRQFHPFTYRHLHAFKDPYKYSFFPNTIIHWNLLPQTIVPCPTVNTFREKLTPTEVLRFLFKNPRFYLHWLLYC